MLMTNMLTIDGFVVCPHEHLDIVWSDEAVARV